MRRGGSGYERLDVRRQTEEFLKRLERNRDTLPDLLVRLSEVLLEGIQELESPRSEDVRLLLQRLYAEIGSRHRLRATCGETGQWCRLCPFGAFIPPELEFSSEAQPVCLPWILIVGYDVC